MRTPEENKVYMKAYYAKNREKMRAQQAVYNEANRGKLREWHKAFYENNKEKRQALMAAFQAANPGYRDQYNAAYYVQNRGGFIRRARERRGLQKQATPSWGNADKIEAFYATASGLSMLLGEWYEVDHIIPLKHPKVCGLHVEYNLQVLTQPANRAKSNKINLG